MKVYVLQHEHEHADGTSDVKMIGIYGSEREARGAQARLSTAPGFKDHREGFAIDAYELGTDHWTEGYCTVHRDDDGARAENEAA